MYRIKAFPVLVPAMFCEVTFQFTEISYSAALTFIIWTRYCSHHDYGCAAK